MPKHEIFMARCIELAKKGLGHVAPNPMVGAVIVSDGKIIGEGYHQVYGEAHAEVNAINSVKHKELLKKSTLYVSLEPCAHFGKTPPCSDLIISMGIPHVVIGIQDIFSQVNGMGIQRLRENGIEVEVGVLEEECRILNKRFFKFHSEKRPYVILKWAQSLDGYIAPNDASNGEIFWITDSNVQMLTHKWRTEEDAILVGRKTVESDNPSLTSRAYFGKNPIRVIIDENLKLSSGHAVFNKEAVTLVFNSSREEIENNVIFKKINFSIHGINEMMRVMYEMNIQSIIIEGGANTINRFIEIGIWDEARVLIGENILLGKGVKSPNIEFGVSFTNRFSNSKIITTYKS